MKICYHKTNISSYQGDMIIFKKDKPDVRSLLSTMQQCGAGGKVDHTISITIVWHPFRNMSMQE